ncbi:MAG: helix-turn-helix transcriptional regulator [Deltaproteobacteria bacterium]|nr:helix-turn-helix transcriptional regulator [Deltaproteobacteria bacterium]MBI3295635.1 helix-turn-helix transcriptional regulator [Deltaproteobacteria bacterium]
MEEGVGFVLPNRVRIAAIIRERGFKNYWVAEQAGLHKTTLYRWFSGQTSFVKRQSLERLAAVLLTEPGELVSNP